jgi:cell division protein FtsQ
MVLTRHRTVVWGGGDRSARKAAVLAVLLHRKARIYDVSAPDAPTTHR